MSLADRSALEIAAGCRARAFSPVEVVEACLDRIAALDPALGACLAVPAERALARARALAGRIARGAAPPLAGVPFGVKDVIDTAGVATTGASRAFAGRVPGRDATVVGRLQRAGGVLLAKLDTTELSAGAAWNPSTGPVRNPWDPARYAGGSSGGPAAATAAGMVPVALGEDTGGSVRLPAAYCGVVGLKPTAGRVSRAGCLACAWSFDTVGPMAREVADVAAVLAVIAGRDPADPACSRRPVPRYPDLLRERLDGVRVGVLAGGWFEDADPDVLDRVRAALATLEALGAGVVEVELEGAELATAAQWVVMRSELASLLGSSSVPKDLLDRTLTRKAALGGTWTAADYLKAQRFRHWLQLRLQRLLERVDVLATVAAPTPAPRFEGTECVVEWRGRRRSWSAASAAVLVPFSLTGVPALTVPCGLTAGGLPVGLQLAGPPHGDGLVLAVANAYQHAAPMPRPDPARTPRHGEPVINP